MSNSRIFPSVVTFAALALAVAGCVYRGDVASPAARKATWFSYLAADDLRERCAPGGLEEYRLIYNAVWDEQVRAYDTWWHPGDRRGMLFANVFGGGGDVSTFTPFDVAGPWRGPSAQRALNASEFQALREAIRDSGFEAPAPDGLDLYSFAFYWVAAACVDGRFRFNAWQHPSPGFDRLRFPQVLWALDPTGATVNPVRRVDFAVGRARMGRALSSDFVMKVRADGLAARLTLF